MNKEISISMEGEENIAIAYDYISQKDPICDNTNVEKYLMIWENELNFVREKKELNYKLLTMTKN